MDDPKAQSVDRPSSLETLARETDTPLDVVDTLYLAECAKLEREARIDLYIPVLAHRRVKSLLKSRHDGTRTSKTAEHRAAG